MKDRIKSFFTVNTFEKLLSLFLALIIWFYMGVQNPERDKHLRDLPITVKTELASQGDRALSVIYSSSSTADIYITGKRNTILNFSEADVNVFVDATDKSQPGTYHLPVVATTKVSDVSLFVSTPDKIEVRLDYTENKTIPVEVVLDNSVKSEGYTEPETTLSSESIDISGPATEVDQIVKAVVSMKVTESGKTSKDLTVRYVDTVGNEVDGKYIKTSNSSINVTTNIYTKKTVPVTASVDYGSSKLPSNSVSLSVYPSTVEIYGFEEDIAGIESIALDKLDINNISDGESVAMKINLPSNKVYLSNTDTVNVSVNFVSVFMQTVSTSKISIINVTDNLTAVANDSLVTLKVRTDKAVTGDDVVVVVDMSSVSQKDGIIYVPATVSFTNGAVGQALQDINIAIKVTEK